jgi:Cd2+/Zn2+-exporting ATPase
METETNREASGDHCGRTACCAGEGSPTASTAAIANVRASGGAATFRIATMDCSAEEAEIRRALEPLAGIRSLSFQLRARTLAIDADPAELAVALQAIRKVGFDPKPLTANVVKGAGHEHDHDAHHDHAGHSHEDAQQATADDDNDHGFESGLGRLGASLALAVGAEAIAYFAPVTTPWHVVGMVVAGVAIALSGLDTYKKGLGALRHGRLNINALMTVAVTGAFLLGQWPEAAMVMALYSIAELIEARSVDRARNAIQGLMSLAPEVAEVRQSDGSWLSTPVAAIAVGAVIRVKPGERVPSDGKVLTGNSAIDQASVTGESIPVDKTPGDPVFAATINQAGALEITVTAKSTDSTLSRIIRSVEQAQSARAPTQRFVDKFAAIYTPAVFAVALATAILLPLLGGVPWLQAAYKALVLLVIACPCALVISTPVTVVSGLVAAARMGILLKGGAYLEQARTIKAIALDKTGTLTEGKPSLVESLNLADGDFRPMAAALAGRSDHPVSKAIAQGLPASPSEVIDFQAVVGKGVQGWIDGTLFFLGNRRLIRDMGLATTDLDARLAAQESQGRTVTLLATQGRALVMFAVADTIKASSAEAVKELASLGVTAVMLTGDNATTAKVIAAQAGIALSCGDLLPQDKLEAIKDLQRTHGVTAMVGDGINDAPSLAQSDIGFAMGAAGTDVAMEAADVVIMNDDLRRVATTIRLSRKTRAVLMQNITLALGIKAVFLVMAIFGNATMWMAVFADMGASLLVVANGLRMLRK